MSDKIRITYGELNDSKIDKILVRLEEEASLRKGAGTSSEGLKKASFYYKSWFNLMMAGLVGAIIAWGILEPHLSDEDISSNNGNLFIILFPLVGGIAGMMIGCMEGILARNFIRALKGGGIGLAIGFLGGFVSQIFCGIALTVVFSIGIGIVGEQAVRNPQHHIGGFMLIMIGRSLGWLFAGMTVGLGPGIALKSKKLIFNGFLGGMIGAVIGGVLFDPINYVVSGGTLEKGVEVSRALGFGITGAVAGLMIGLVEMLTMDAWLLMTAGPIKGKQFMIYKNPTIIGSAPKCEIYLFKDPSIEPMHAVINIVRDGYEIEDRNTPSGTWINGRRIKRHRLISGDEIRIGGVKLLYSEKERKTSGM